MQGWIALENGSVFFGDSFGYPKTVEGELVFNTSMTGYQEALTDPSYAGQMLMFTFPQIGNYGCDPKYYESSKIQVNACLVKEWCRSPHQGKMNLDDRQLKWTDAIIKSMTPAERISPEIINGSRRKRIAEGSGRSVQEVNQLLKQFHQMQMMMKKIGKQGKINFPFKIK